MENNSKVAGKSMPYIAVQCRNSLCIGAWSWKLSSVSCLSLKLSSSVVAGAWAGADTAMVFLVSFVDWLPRAGFAYFYPVLQCGLNRRKAKTELVSICRSPRKAFALQQHNGMHWLEAEIREIQGRSKVLLQYISCIFQHWSSHPSVTVDFPYFEFFRTK